MWRIACALALLCLVPAALRAQNPAYLNVGAYNLTLTVQQHPSIPTQYRVMITAASTNWPGWVNVTAGNANGLTDINNWGASGGNSFDTNNRAAKYSPYFTPTNTSFQWTWHATQHSPSAGPVNSTFTLVGNLQQTVTLTPNSGTASIVEGQTFIGQASGAQAGNAYNISIVSGPGSAAINSSTGAYTVTANGVGTVVYKVWASAGGGYVRSEDVTASVTAAEGAKVRVTLPANNGDKPITYKLEQDGQVIGETTVQPGQTAQIVTVNVGGNTSNVTLRSYTQGVAYDDGVLVEDANGSIENPGTQTITPSTSTTPVSAELPKAEVKTAGSNIAESTGRTKVVWGASGQSSDPAEQTDLLTNKTYREGVERSVELDSIALDALNEVPQGDAMTAKGQAAKAEAAAVVDSIFVSVGSAAPAPDKSTPTFGGSLGSQIEAKWTWAMNYIDPAVQWVNLVVRWIIAVWYVLWVMKELDRKLVTSMMLPQAKGNPVAAGTGAQVTGLVAAAGISAALLTVPVLLWTAYTTPWDTVMAGAELAITSIPSFPSGGGEPVSMAMGWVAWILPLDMILAIPALVILVRKAGWVIILGVAAVIRFIVP